MVKWIVSQRRRTKISKKKTKTTSWMTSMTPSIINFGTKTWRTWSRKRKKKPRKTRKSKRKKIKKSLISAIGS